MITTQALLLVRTSDLIRMNLGNVGNDGGAVSGSRSPKCGVASGGLRAQLAGTGALPTSGYPRSNKQPP